MDDVIISIQSSPVRNLAQFQNRLADSAPGKTVSLGVIRDGERKDLSVKLEPAPEQGAENRIPLISERMIPQLRNRVRTLRSGMFTTKASRYNTFGEKTEEREYDVRGVRIMLPPSAGPTRRPGSPSTLGQIIVKCEDKPVRSVADLLDVLRAHKPGDRVAVEFYETGSTTRKSELEITGTDTQPAQ